MQPDYLEFARVAKVAGHGVLDHRLQIDPIVSLRETFAQRSACSNVRRLYLPLPLGEGRGEGLPGNRPSDYAKVSCVKML